MYAVYSGQEPRLTQQELQEQELRTRLPSLPPSLFDHVTAELAVDTYGAWPAHSRCVECSVTLGGVVCGVWCCQLHHTLGFESSSCARRLPSACLSYLGCNRYQIEWSYRAAVAFTAAALYVPSCAAVLHCCL